MCGVLLQRRKSRCEWVNDTDGELVNWWTMVRDQNEALVRLLSATPRWSEALWAEADRRLTAGVADPLWQAYWWTVRSAWSMAGGGRNVGRMVGKALRNETPLPAKIAGLYDRIRDVHIACEDAVRLLGRLAASSYWTIYCDPPYAGTATEFYQDQAYDRQALSEVLLAQKSFAAVSGYGIEWDHLGWYRQSVVTSSTISPSEDGSSSRRVEVIWSNRPLPGEQARLPI